MGDRELCVEILEKLATHNPLGLRKAELLAMRDDVLNLVADYLAGEYTPPTFNPSQLPAAYATVLNYEGNDRFLSDLQRALRVYGSLTENQVAAVLDPPNEAEIAELATFDVSPPEYRWQAIDLIREIRRSVRRAAKAKLGD